MPKIRAQAVQKDSLTKEKQLEKKKEKFINTIFDNIWNAYLTYSVLISYSVPFAGIRTRGLSTEFDLEISEFKFQLRY